MTAKEAVAKKALPECNIVLLTGDDMKKALKEYFSVLYSFNRRFTVCSMKKVKIPVWFLCKSFVTGWKSACGSFLTVNFLMILSKK